MNILHLIAGTDPGQAGLREALLQTEQALRDHGHSSEVASLDLPGAGHIAQLPFTVHPQGRWLRKYGYTPRLAPWVAANGTRFDAAIVHGLWNHASVGGWKGLQRAGVPYVLFVHGMMAPWFKARNPLKHLFKQAFWLLWQGKVLRDAKAVIFTCEEERRLAFGVFRGWPYEQRVVSLGIAPPPPASALAPDAFRRQVPALGMRPYLLFLGRLHPVKGCDMLIEAFAMVADDNPSLDLVVAGPDQVGLRQKLVDQANGRGLGHRVHFPGMISGDAKYSAYRGAEAFVLPSHQENFGIVVVEALACRCPVLVSDKVNIWREVADALAGVVGPDTVEGTTASLKHFLALSRAERDAMRDAAVQLFEARFTAKAAGAALAGVLEGIVRDGRTPVRIASSPSA